jgi:putative flippase GtrA
MRKEMPGHGYSVPAYLGAGGIATAAHYATQVALVELVGVQPLAASGAGFAVGAAVKYWLNYVFVFRSETGHTEAVPRFAATLVILFVLNLMFFHFFNEALGLHYTIAQVLTTVANIPPGYVLSRLWVYKWR